LVSPRDEVGLAGGTGAELDFSLGFLLKGWRRGGDVRVYVDLAELRQLLEFKPAPDQPYEPDPVTGPQNT